MTYLIKTVRSGQITIPIELRKELGLSEQSVLQIELKQGELRIRPVQVTPGTATSWLTDLYAYFAPVREEIQAQGRSEGEVNADIDAAVAAVRKEHAGRS